MLKITTQGFWDTMDNVLMEIGPNKHIKREYEY